MAEGGRFTTPYTWEPKALRYRAANGRFVPLGAVRGVLDAAQADVEGRMVALTQQLRAQSINLAQWEAGMRKEVATIHTAAGAIAQGGRQHMSPAAWGHVGADVKFHYAKLHAFAEQIAAGTQRLDGTAEARTRLYARGATSTFQEARRRLEEQAEPAAEKNQLGSADHCSQCLSETARGWVDVGSLSTPGTRICLGRCHCRLIYRARAEAQQAA